MGWEREREREMRKIGDGIMTIYIEKKGGEGRDSYYICMGIIMVMVIGGEIDDVVCCYCCCDIIIN